MYPVDILKAPRALVFVGGCESEEVVTRDGVFESIQESVGESSHGDSAVTSSRLKQPSGEANH